MSTRPVSLDSLGITLDVPERWEVRSAAAGGVVIGPNPLTVRHRLDLTLRPSADTTSGETRLSERRVDEAGESFLVIEGMVAVGERSWGVEAWVAYARDEAPMRAMLASIRPRPASP